MTRRKDINRAEGMDDGLFIRALRFFGGAVRFSRRRSAAFPPCPASRAGAAWTGGEYAAS